MLPLVLVRIVRGSCCRSVTIGAEIVAPKGWCFLEQGAGGTAGALGLCKQAGDVIA
jgi:hypothetical protein